MSRISLLGGAYSSRSLIASAQRCVNMFPEATPQENGPPTPVTHQLSPGLTTYLTLPVGTVRGMYRCSTGMEFAVVGTSLYYINPFTGTATLWGTACNATALNNAPVSFADNGLVCLIVDGSGRGWYVNARFNTFGVPLDATIYNMDADPAFYGSFRVVYLDGYFILGRPNTNQFYVSPPFWDGTTPWDGTQIASKTGGPDPINAVATINGNLWLLGIFSSEVWFNSGAQDFPFERQPGVFIEHGLGATYSVAATDVELIFFGRDRDGAKVVFKSEGYGLKRISNHAVEWSWAGAAQDVSDAVAFVYQLGGHTFYQVTLPSLNVTWVYDLSTGEWHERTYTDSGTGVESRHRANCCMFDSVNTYVGDYVNGKIYRMDVGYTDDGAPITRRRGMPHIVKDGVRISHNRLIVDLDVANVPAGAQVFLRWSDDRGKTFGNPITLTVASTYSSLMVSRLGLARDRVYEVYWTFPYPTSLQGAWLEAEKADT